MFHQKLQETNQAPPDITLVTHNIHLYDPDLLFDISHIKIIPYFAHAFNFNHRHNTTSLHMQGMSVE